jgi:hypothetical protein
MRKVFVTGRPAEVPGMPQAADAQLAARAAFIAPDVDRDAGRSDAAAGCEYVDDQIRLPSDRSNDFFTDSSD